MKKKLVVTIILLVTVMFSFSDKAEAKTLQDLYNQLAKLQSEYNANKKNKTMTQSEIAESNQQISNITENIEQIRKDIEKNMI